MCNVPVVHKYSVFDEVQDVVEVGQVSDVDDLSPVGRTKQGGQQNI